MFKILVVEDDGELRQLFIHVLTQNGYAARGAANGREALDAVENEYFDLIISDVMMTGVDGYELARQLRGAGNTIPIMMITARSEFDDMRQGFIAGTDDYR